jgi:hypothetical protein
MSFASDIDGGQEKIFSIDEKTGPCATVTRIGNSSLTVCEHP